MKRHQAASPEGQRNITRSGNPRVAVLLHSRDDPTTLGVGRRFSLSYYILSNSSFSAPAPLGGLATASGVASNGACHNRRRCCGFAVQGESKKVGGCVFSKCVFFGAAAGRIQGSLPGPHSLFPSFHRPPPGSGTPGAPKPIQTARSPLGSGQPRRWHLTS